MTSSVPADFAQASLHAGQENSRPTPNTADAEPHVAKLCVVYFGNDWAAENRTSSHHIASRLAGQVDLLYVDSPGMRAPTGSRRDLSRIWRKIAQAFQKPQRVEPGLWRCTVPQLPWHHVPGVPWLNKQVGAWAVRRAMRHARLQNPILWFVVPHPAMMVDAIDHRLLIYYCIDDYAAHPGVDVARISACDALLTQRADHVFVAPPALLEKKQQMNANTSYAPHGVDVDLFARAQAPQTVVPALAQILSKPVIGYFGLLAPWTDIELLVWLAQQRPQWSFLLVGHASADISALRQLPNVHLVGPQPYQTLPEWAKAFDVAIIPYRQNQQVRNANPLKLREYLATGKPIVSVPAPEVEKFPGLVRVALDYDAYLAAIELSIQEDNAQLRASRIASVRDMSWDHRARSSLQIATDCLDAKRQAN